MLKKRSWKELFAAFVCVLSPIMLLADDQIIMVDPIVGQNAAIPAWDEVGVTDMESVKQTPPIVIMSDDPEYQRFVENYATKRSLQDPTGPFLNSELTIERVIELDLPSTVREGSSKNRLFIFQNITQATKPNAQAIKPNESPVIPLMEFRRDQIEHLKKISAGKKAQ